MVVPEASVHRRVRVEANSMGGTREVTTEPTSGLGGSELERELDRLSLEQALRDFEIANARVVDLTQRLVDLSGEVTALREQLVGAQEALVVARAENAAIRSSPTFRLADIAKKLLARLRS